MMEPAITINGHYLTEAQASTIRCAIEAMASSLADGLGEDTVGRELTAAYKARIDELRAMIFHG